MLLLISDSKVESYFDCCETYFCFILIRIGSRDTPNIGKMNVPFLEPMKLVLRLKKPLTAMTFSRMPPTGSTLPVSEISPVIAICCLTGLLSARESSDETRVTPAEGPSFGVAP